MNIKVKELVLINNNPIILWKIDGCLFEEVNYIPEYLLEKNVFDWRVDLWNGIVIITTEYHE